MPPKKRSTIEAICTHSRLDHLMQLRETCCCSERTCAATHACLGCTPPCSSSQTLWIQPPTPSRGHQISWLSQISVQGRTNKLLIMTWHAIKLVRNSNGQILTIKAQELFILSSQEKKLLTSSTVATMVRISCVTRLMLFIST